MKKLIILIIVNCALLIPSTRDCYSQFTWQRTYTSAIGGDEEGFDVCAAESTNFYIAGSTGITQYNLFIVKINNYGDTIWRKSPGLGQIYTVEPVISGGCIYAGRIGGIALAGRVKANGDTLWQKTFNAINFLDMKTTLDGNYILCGVEYSNNRYNGYICKIDTLGNIVWENTYPSLFSIDFITIELAPDGGYIAGGIKQDFSGGPRYSYICKINETGVLIWDKGYNLGIFSFISGIQKMLNGYILTGISINKIHILKVNINGDSTHAKILSNTNNIPMGPVILRENDNKYYLAHVNEWGFESRVYSLDSNLNIINQVNLQGTYGLYLSSIVKIQNSEVGDIILAGWGAFNAINDVDAYAVRLDSTLKLPPPIGISNNSNIIPLDFILHQNYPNPFNPSTNIKFSIPERSLVTLKIYNMLGSEINTLVNADMPAGNYRAQWDASGSASGIYFVVMQSGAVKLTKKMAFLK
jgi:hypothetical protein